MDYRIIYKNLMERAMSRSINAYTEKHHIKPRCIGGGDESSNIVRLTPEEHYLAHQLLVRIHPTVPGIVRAAVAMTATNQNSDRSQNKLYGWLRRKLAESMRTNNPNAGGASRRAYVARMGAAPSGWTGRVSDEGRQKIARMKRESNPMHGIKPWNHPKATDQSRAVWADADKYYEWWKVSQRSYHAMAKHFNFDKPLMTHHNMVKYFRAGWIPREDFLWIDFLRLE